MSRPPPPPPPPPLPTHLSKRSNPAGQANLPAPVPQAQAGPRRNAGEADVVGEPFRPCHMFFYGSLMDPEVIQAVLALPDLPTTQAASISGFRVRMWGPYPTLLPSSAGTVLGRVWKVTSEEHFNRLAEYETAAYRWVECDARPRRWHWGKAVQDVLLGWRPG